MIQFMLRVLINGVLLAIVLPSVFPSIAFHGNFWPEGVAAGIVFAITVLLVELMLFALGIFTLGIGFILRNLFWFLVPAIQLWVMASWFPQYLCIDSFFPTALLAGMVLWLVNLLTGTTPTGDRRS